MLWISILGALALAPASALVWWYRIRVAVEVSRPVGIYERVADLLERQWHPMEDDVRASVEQEAYKEFRIALDSEGSTRGRAAWCYATTTSSKSRPG